MIWLNWVGEGRTGTTVLSGAFGSRLDCKIAEEQGYIGKWHREGCDRGQIMSLLHQSGVGRARQAQGWSNINEVEGTPLVVGDKHPWGAVNAFTKRGAPASIISDFEAAMGMKVKTLVTVRHPLDTITAWVASNKYKRIYSNDGLRFRRMIRRYKRFYTAAEDIVKYADYRIVVHEELCKDPNSTLQDLCNWIGLPDDKEWRQEAGSRINTSPHQRRNDVEWPEEYLDRVNAFIDECSLLEYYRSE